MEEYEVKIKDIRQDITHTIRQLAKSKNEANSIVLEFLRDNLGHDEFEIVG